MKRDSTEALDQPAQTTPELLHALAAWERLLRHEKATSSGEQQLPSAFLVEILDASELVKRTAAHIDGQVPPEPPRQLDDRRRWLLDVAELYLAHGGARRLAENSPAQKWAISLANALAEIVERRLNALRFVDRLWIFGDLAEGELAGMPGSEPWKTVLACVMSTEVAEADRTSFVRYWGLGELCSRDVEFLREAVRVDGPWREAYRRHLRDCFAEIRYMRMDHRLFVEPVVTLPLPHLSRWIEVLPGREGVEVFWGDTHRQLPCTFRGGRLSLAVDETTGTISAKVTALKPHVLQVAFQASRAAVELGEKDEVANSKILSVADGIAEALVSKDWFASLKRAANAFDQGEDPLEDDELAVAHALEARVGLGLLMYRAGTTPRLASKLVQIDKNLKEISHAVLLLDDDDYIGILVFLVPRPGTWLGECARIAERISSVTLEAALEEWGAREEPSSAPEVRKMGAAPGVADEFVDEGGRVDDSHGPWADFIPAAAAVGRLAWGKSAAICDGIRRWLGDRVSNLPCGLCLASGAEVRGGQPIRLNRGVAELARLLRPGDAVELHLPPDGAFACFETDLRGVITSPAERLPPVHARIVVEPAPDARVLWVVSATPTIMGLAVGGHADSIAVEVLALVPCWFDETDN